MSDEQYKFFISTIEQFRKEVEETTNLHISSIDTIIIDDTHIKLKYNFTDGTSTESNTILLPQGPKGDKGDKGDSPVITIGQNGHWYIDGVDSQVSALGRTTFTGDFIEMEHYTADNLDYWSGVSGNVIWSGDTVEFVFKFNNGDSRYLGVVTINESTNKKVYFGSIANMYIAQYITGSTRHLFVPEDYNYNNGTMYYRKLS